MADAQIQIQLLPEGPAFWKTEIAYKFPECKGTKVTVIHQLNSFFPVQKSILYF